MKAPIYRTAKLSAQVLLQLGNPEPRLYPFGQNDDQPRVYPYAVYTVVGGSPDNFLAGRPDIDGVTLQVDVYASDTQGAVRAEAAALALRDALELDCHIVNWRGSSQDPETKSFRVSFDCDWYVPR